MVVVDISFVVATLILWALVSVVELDRTFCSCSGTNDISCFSEQFNETKDSSDDSNICSSGKPSL